MYPFPSTQCAAGVPPAVAVGTPTTQLASGSAQSVALPAGVQNGDILILFATWVGGTPAVSGTAVASWSANSISLTGYDMVFFWGVVTNAAGTVTYATNANEAVELTAWRYASTVTKKQYLSQAPGSTSTSLSYTGFTKNLLSRGVVALFGGYNQGSTAFAVGAGGPTLVNSYKQTAASPAGTSGGTALGAAFAQPAAYVDGATITISNFVVQTTFFNDGYLLELT